MSGSSRPLSWLPWAGVAGVVAVAAAMAWLWGGAPATPAARHDEVDAGVVPVRDEAPPEPAEAALPPPIAPRARTDERPDILLFTIDTLRADHVSSYGYDRHTTPTIDALAARGARFTRAYTTSSWTLPAVTSLFTGLIPSAHGVLRSQVNESGVVVQEPVGADLPWLAATLHDAGYLTVGVVANPHLTAPFGYSRGFDRFEGLGQAEGERVGYAIESEIEALRTADRPFFLWVHVLDPHVPYTPRDPQFGRWWPETRPRYPALDTMPFAVRIAGVAREQHIALRDAMEYVVAAYDSEVRAADAQLRDVLARLDDGHLVVVVASDHGEEFGDHLSMGHGNTLFEELVHVPLVVSVPGAAPQTSEGMASILDVYPTLAELAHATMPAGPIGRSLVPATRGEALPASRELVLESGRGQVLHAILDGRWKFAERTEPQPIEGLFDLRSDPFEQRSQLRDEPDVASALRERLHEVLAQAAATRAPSPPPVAIPDETREQLEALGYGQ